MLGERDPDPNGRELLVPELEPEAECDGGENTVPCVRAVPGVAWRALSYSEKGRATGQISGVGRGAP